MKHVSHDGKLYEITSHATPVAWDEHVGELIFHEGKEYLVHRVICIDSTSRPARIAVALIKSVATLLLTFRLSKVGSHWEGAWSGKEVKHVAHKIDV